MRALRRFLAMLLTAALLFSAPAAAFAEDGQPFAMTVVVDGNATPVRALQDAYEGNVYLSLRDLSAALSGGRSSTGTVTAIPMRTVTASTSPPARRPTTTPPAAASRRAAA